MIRVISLMILVVLLLQQAVYLFTLNAAATFYREEIVRNQQENIEFMKRVNAGKAHESSGQMASRD